MPNLDDADLAARLATVLPVGRVAHDRVTRIAYSRDASPLSIKSSMRDTSPHIPRAVVWPETTTEVQGIIGVARAIGLPLIPYGGGSGIVGSALAGPNALIVDMKRMDRILEIDRTSMTVHVQAGMLGMIFEDRLNAGGLTCGHLPQSMQSSTVGGWLAHRGVGALSTKYGRIQDLVLSLEVVLPSGDVVRTRTVPASAAGPDLGRLFIGAEGTLGIVTAVTLQVFPMPEARIHRAFEIETFDRGLDVVRQIIQRGLRPAVIRLYDRVEAQDRFASIASEGSSVLLMIAEGDPALTETTMTLAGATVASRGGRDLGASVGERWLADRTSTATLCRAVQTPTGIADALEVANVWSRLGATYERMRMAMEAAVGEAGRVYGHASHFYHSGANLYMIFEADAADPASVPELYREILGAAFDACHAEGGTLTHHHGVGPTKDAWLRRELGDGGMDLWHTVRAAIDPTGLMNPGTLRG